ICELQQGKAAGTLSDSSKLTLEQYLNHWVENIARPAIRHTSYVSYRGIVNGHLIPRLGRNRLDKLSALHIQAMQADLEKEGMKPRRRQMLHATLRRA